MNPEQHRESSDDSIRTWRRVSRILGVPETTLQRQRARAGARVSKGERPWFRNAEEVVTWYRALRQVPAPPPPVARSRSTEAPLDHAALADELYGRGR